MKTAPPSEHNAPDGVILFAHGSRDPLWRKPIEAVAERMRSNHAGIIVDCAYLELCEPSLPDATRAMVTAWQNATDSIALRADPIRGKGLKPLKIRIIPMFLGMGKHAREDLPLLVTELRAAHPQIEFEVAQTIGEDARVTALLADLAAGA